MNQLKLKILTASFLIAIILASSYCSLTTAQQSEWQAQPMHRIKGSDVNPNAAGDGTAYFNPAKIQAVYKLSTDPKAGSGTTIAIVDAYDDPKVATDLSLFSQQFGLLSPNFELHKMSSLISGNTGWAMEISLDVQWAHAIAPGAKILLVEARSSSLTDLLSAVDYARNRADVSAISMSWGGSEFAGQISYDSYFTSQYGASFFASSGDTGGVITWPSSSANVIAVGGTTLTQTGSSYTETAWSGSGGGISTQVPQPTYQTGLLPPNNMRTTPDVSYNADPNTGFLVVDNYGYSGSNNWWIVGGTSAGAPQWAAIQAIGKTATNNNFYAQQNYGKDFSDVIGGSSGSFPAISGYDLATGIGTPLGTNFGAPPTPDYTVTVSPSTVTINAGSSTTPTVTVTSINGFNNPVTITATTPTGWTTPDPIIVTPTASAPLTITVPSTANGQKQIAITASDGTTSKTTTITITVVKPDFSLTTNPTSLTIRQGSSGTSRITVNAINNYQGAAKLTLTGTPAGMTASFSQNPVSAGSYATMTLTTGRSTPQGTSIITVTGTDANGLAHSTQITVKVR